MSTTFDENPYLAPASGDYSAFSADAVSPPGFLALLVFTLLSAAAGIVSFFVSVWALILGGALSGEPFFTIGICLATFLPFVVAFQVAQWTKKSLRLAYNRLFPLI